MGAAKAVYTYDGNKQVRRVFDAKNTPAQDDGVSVFEYTLDSTGMRVALRFWDEVGQPVENRNKIQNYVWKEIPEGKK